MTLFEMRTLIFGTTARNFHIFFIIVAMSFFALVHNAQGAQVTLAWDASTGSSIAGYRMHYGTSSGHYSDSIDAGSGSTCTVPNLTAGTTYFFAVTAYNSDGTESGFSNEVSYAVPAEVTLTSIAIGGPTQVNENSTAQYTCTANYSDGSSQVITSGVSWSENSAVAAITSNGVLTAAAVANDATVTITATYNGKTDTHAITVRNVPPALSSITIGGPIQVSENSSAQYTCTANYSDGSSQVITSGVSWSENSAAATITSSGVLSADSVASDTIVSISATYSGHIDTHSVTIKKNAVTLTSLSISGPTRLDEESSGQYTCTARYSDDSTSMVTDSVQWSVNSQFAAINASGTLTTRTVQSEEHATIIATFESKQSAYELIIENSKTNYCLNIHVTGSGTVLLDPPGGIYEKGTVVTLTAEADWAWAFDGWIGAVEDTESSTTSVIMDSDMELSATFLEDTDLDSVPDQEEWGSDSKDKSYDGNADGIADYLQNNVASLHTIDYQNYISVSAKEPGRITMCQTLDTDFMADVPADRTLPLGLIAYRIEGIPSGTGATLTIYLPAGSDFDTFYKFGPTSDDPTDHWYEFMFDQSSETGAVLDNNAITLFLKDGSRGDNDLAENGVISDTGGPALLGADPTPPGQQLSDNNPASSTSAGSSNGCFIDSIFMSPN